MIVKPDLKKNRLYLKISGSVSKKALEKLYTDVRFAVADLRPGFSVIDDLSECTLCHISGIVVYKKISNYLIKMGVRDVIRIIDKDSLVLKQFFNFAARFSEYIPVYVNTPEEAEELLDKSDRRNRLRFHFANLPTVEYVANGSKGEGHVFDISASGCKISRATTIPEVGQEIDVVIAFNSPEAIKQTFGLKANIIRIDHDGFAIEHKYTDESEKEQLWQYLLRKFEYESEACPAELTAQPLPPSAVDLRAGKLDQSAG